MGSNYKHVFSPIEIRGIRYKNRIEMSPTSPKYTDSKGYMTKEHIDYFRPMARGGAGIITLGNCTVDIENYQDEPRQVALDNDDYIIGIGRLADMFDQYGVVGQPEINHAGLNSVWDFNRVPGLGPSSRMMPKELIRAQIYDRAPVRGEEMCIDDIRRIQKKYIDAAYRCKTAGLRSCFIHAGHGNLIGQFSSPKFNRRTDEYGGKLENRAKFAIEILDGIRKKCGEDFVIEMRISADEMDPEGMHFEETKEYLKMLDGKFDIVNVSCGLHTDFKYFKYWSPTLYMGKAINVKYAAELKKILKSKVCAVAGIMNIDDAEKIISEGCADFCAMARALMADPEMPRKYAANRGEDVRPCTRCNYCGRRIGSLKTVACAVNPALGRDSELINGCVPPALKKKKVAVIGGGPGGMQATLTLRERGHSVVLFEKERELGGNLIAASSMELKTYMRAYLKYITGKVKECGAEIRLETTATAETVLNLHPDALVVAVGAEPFFPKVAGIDLPHVHWAAHADLGKCKVGNNVVIIGAGSLGLESAVTQSSEGKNVLVLEVRDEIPVGAVRDEILLEMLEKNGGKVLTSCALAKIYEDRIVYSEIGTGQVREYKCDTVLVAAGLRSRKTVVEELSHVLPETEIYVIGDAVRANMIGDAVRGGFDAALSI